jgi:preprotein translocase subunit SecE
MVDNFKLLAAALLVAVGIAGFYLLSEMPTVVRVVSVLAGLAAATGVAWFTVPGRQFFAFSQESITEARKVVRQVEVGRSPHGVWTLDHAPRL